MFNFTTKSVCRRTSECLHTPPRPQPCPVHLFDRLHTRGTQIDKAGQVLRKLLSLPVLFLWHIQELLCVLVCPACLILAASQFFHINTHFLQLTQQVSCCTERLTYLTEAQQNSLLCSGAASLNSNTQLQLRLLP